MKFEDVLVHLDAVKIGLAEMAGIKDDPDTLSRSIAIQLLLHRRALIFTFL